MIIASKGHVRMKGRGADILSEFTTIARALFDHEEVSPDILKKLIDFAYQEKKDGDKNEHRAD